MRALVLGFLFTGCCGSPPPAPPGALALELGAPGAHGFTALTDGQDVELVAGAQGGFHVWLDFRVSGIAPGTVRLERTAHRAGSGELVLRTSGTVDVGAPDPSGGWVSPSPLPMFMCPTPIGLSIVDRPIVFELRFTADGAPLVDRTITLVPHCPTAQRDLCMRICTG